MSALLVEAHMGNTLHVIYTRQRAYCGVILFGFPDSDCSPSTNSHVCGMKYCSRLSKLRSDPMKYRENLSLALFDLERGPNSLSLFYFFRLLFARLEKQATVVVQYEFVCSYYI